MGLFYTEFRTTGQTFMYDLAAAIANCTDWAKQNSTSVVLSTSGATTAGATSLPFSATGSSGWAIGKIIRIGAAGASDSEYRKITAISGTSITVAAMTYAHPSGTNIYDGAEVYKATTTRGADMVVDFMDDVADLQRAYVATYRSVGGDKSKQMQVWYKGQSSPGTFATNAIYVTLSISKEHLFLALEGPRPSDPNGQDSIGSGSVKSYFFINDMIPYFASGIDPSPVVVAGGNYQNAIASGFGNLSDKALVSRNIANSVSWGTASLQTLEIPGVNQSNQRTVVNRLSPDGNIYLAPYVVFDDSEGIRGRLGNIYYAGPGQNVVGSIAPLAAGAIVTIGTDKFKLIVANRMTTSAGGNWGPLGVTWNQNDPTIWILIAVPTT